MDNPASVPLSEVPAVGFTLVHQLPVDQRSGEAKNLTFQGFFPADASTALINELVDRLVKTSDRQRAKIRLKEVVYQLIIEKNAHKNAVERLFEVDTMHALREQQDQVKFAASGRRNPNARDVAAAAKDAADRDAAVTNINVAKQRVATLEEEQAALENVIAEG